MPWPYFSRLGVDGEEFFTSYDEVYDSFDAMGLQENLLRGIYAYGMYTTNLRSLDFVLHILWVCVIKNYH